MKTMCFNLFCVDVHRRLTDIICDQSNIENVVFKHYPKVKLNLKIEDNTDLTIN